MKVIDMLAQLYIFCLQKCSSALKDFHDYLNLSVKHFLLTGITLTSSLV